MLWLLLMVVLVIVIGGLGVLVDAALAGMVVVMAVITVGLLGMQRARGR